MPPEVYGVVSAQESIRAGEALAAGRSSDQNRQYPPSHLPHQICIFFNYFWSVEVVSADSTIDAIESTGLEGVQQTFGAGDGLTGGQVTNRRAKAIAVETVESVICPGDGRE